LLIYPLFKLEVFFNSQQYNQTGVSWPTGSWLKHSDWLAALKTDGPIAGNITGSCHIPV